MHFWPMTLSLAKGLLTSTEIFALTLLFSLPLGLVVALGRMSRIGVVRQIFRLYISVMRGTPLMLQLFFFYFGPYYVFGLSLGRLSLFGVDYRFIAVIIGFSLNYAAYLAEIYRAGIESIPPGQHEAAAVLGFTRGQTFLRIILPQVVKRIVPPVTNEVITLVKDTSLASTLAYQEVFSLAKQISASQVTFMPFLIAAIFYYVANHVVEIVMARIEKALDYYK